MHRHDRRRDSNVLSTLLLLIDLSRSAILILFLAVQIEYEILGNYPKRWRPTIQHTADVRDGCPLFAGAMCESIGR